MTGIIPDEWKTAVVSPLYKNKGLESDPNSYRGISVLPPINKVFETLISNQLRSYFEDNRIFSASQHGFRKNFSCESALHELLSQINGIRDRNRIALLLFIDFRKAFDMLDSEFFIRKLFHYGFNNQSLSFIRNYFSNRKQMVKMGKYCSKFLRILLGVPQGSVLGPLFFLIFINDLIFCFDEIKCKLFADDTTLLYEGEDLSKMITSFKCQLKPLFDWCDMNRLEINWSKTFCMIITNKRISGLKSLKEIELGEARVQIVDKFRLLGITLDTKLNFEFYVSELRLQINRKLYSIKKLFYLSLSVKIQFFKTFILPYFDYCSSTIIYYSSKAIQKLSNCYYLCFYKLFKISFDSNDPIVVNNQLKQWGLFNLHHRLVKKLSLFVVKIFIFKNPPNLAQELKFNFERNLPYDLRNKSKFVQPIVKRKAGESTFSYFFTNFVNKLFVNFFKQKFELKDFKIFLSNNLDNFVNISKNVFHKLNFNIKNSYLFF